MRRPLLFCLLAALVLAPACGSQGNGESGADADGTVQVVAAFHPLAEIVRRVGEHRVAVTDLTPGGTEPHDLELSTRAVDAIEDADLVLYVGGGFQPSVEEAVKRRDGRALDALELDPKREGDPHVWLDPSLVGLLATEVAAVLARIDPDSADDYESNGEKVAATMVETDTKLKHGLAECDRTTIVTAHEAFGRFVARYGLEQQAITGISPEAEPDPRRLAELAELVERDGITTIFTEELVSPEVAESLAREAGVQTATLDTIEGPAEDGASYEDRMLANLAALRAALGCR